MTGSHKLFTDKTDGSDDDTPSYQLHGTDVAFQDSAWDKGLNKITQIIDKTWDGVKTLLADAFEATYNGTGNRALFRNQGAFTSLSMVFSTLLATTSKSRNYYQYVEQDNYNNHPVPTKVDDNNYYNSFEFWLFTIIPLRIAKDLAKLGTEFVPNLVTGILRQLADMTQKLVKSCKDYSRRLVKSESENLQGADESIETHWYWSLKFTIGLVYALALLATGVLRTAEATAWFATKVLQSITSPFAAMKQSFNYFNELSETRKVKKVVLNYAQQSYEDVLVHEYLGPQRFLLKSLGVLVAAGRGLIAVGAYAALAVFGAPVLLGAIAASGSVGSSVVAGLSAAAHWVASLPVISTVGSYLTAGLAAAGSYLGLSMGTAATTAAFVMVATPVLAAGKVFIRWASPKKEQEEPQMKDNAGAKKLCGASNREIDTHLKNQAERQRQHRVAIDRVVRSAEERNNNPKKSNSHVGEDGCGTPPSHLHPHHGDDGSGSGLSAHSHFNFSKSVNASKGASTDVESSQDPFHVSPPNPGVK